jgi:hypothetical protein
MNDQPIISDFNVKGETRTELLFPNGTRELLGPAPVVFGESKDNYERLLARFAADVGPTDFVEWVLIKNIADCTWEIQRLLRFEIEVVRRGVASAARDKMRLELGEGHLDGVEVGAVEPAPAKAGDGRKRNQAPLALTSLSASSPLWLERLSRMTTSPALRTGASWVSM